MRDILRFILTAVASAFVAFALGYSLLHPVTPVSQEALMVSTTAPAPIGLAYETAPSDLWEALIAQGYTGDPTDNREALYVNPGTVIDTPGRTYTATPAGWLICEDWTTTGSECS